MLVALEGHSYSGKTTLINMLKDKYGLCVLYESDRYAKGIDKYPPFPALNRKMANQSIRFFADLEKKRISDYKKYSPKKYIYADRSFFTTILFQKYMKYLNIPGEYSSRSYALRYHFKLLDEGIILIPDFFVYVKCKSLDLYNSRLDREISVDYLKTKEAKTFFESHFQKIYEIYSSFGRSIVIETDNDKDSTERNLRSIMYEIPKITGLNRSDSNEIINKLKDIL